MSWVLEEWPRFEARLRAVEAASRDTINSYRHSIKLFAEFLEETGYADIDQEVLEEFLVWLAESRGLSPTSIQRHFYAVKKFVSWLGVEDIDWRSLRPRGRSAYNFRVLSEDEVRAIIDYAFRAYGEKYGLMLWLGYEAALRVGELLNLRVEQFDPSRSTLIKRPLKREEPCEVPLSRELSAHLAAYIEREGLHPKDYMFTTKFGRPWRRDIFHRHVFRPIVEALGYSDIRYHDFARHSRATNLLRRGVDIYTVNKILCHRLLETTLKYLHIVRAEELRERLRATGSEGIKI